MTAARAPSLNALQGFPPISAPDARLLILGSMPGAASLAAGEYYAHPRNQFWPIICQLFHVPCTLPYLARTTLLTRNRIALWDVVAACSRPGSADAAIDPASIETNDFAAFFHVHPLISEVYFNGRTAEKLFRERVLPGLQQVDTLYLHGLPSTSPANARRSFTEKRDAWQVVADRRLTG